MKKTMTVLGALALAGTAVAASDLQVSEIWPGNEPGANLTGDWFEVTNFGDMPWTITDGTLYFDDDSADETTADALMGVLSIAPGESVVFVDDDSTAEWLSVWGAGLPAGTQVGTYAGSGLGGGGDAVTLFFDAGDNGVTSSDIIDFSVFPFADDNGGQSWDPTVGFSGAFSTVGNAAGAYASTLVNDAGQAAIGSPGTIAPAPGAVALLGLAGFAGVRRRRA